MGILVSKQIKVTTKDKKNPVTLDQDQYEIVPGSYKKNIAKGTASVTIRGKDNYGGSKVVNFKIVARPFILE